MYLFLYACNLYFISLFFISLLRHRDASRPALLSALTFVSGTAAPLTQFMYQSLAVVISCYFQTSIFKNLPIFMEMHKC